MDGFISPLAWKIFKSCRKGPQQLRDLASDVNALYTAIHEFEDEIANPHSRGLAKLIGTKTEEFKYLSGQCLGDLQELDILLRYTAGSLNSILEDYYLLDRLEDIRLKLLEHTDAYVQLKDSLEEGEEDDRPTSTMSASRPPVRSNTVSPMPRQSTTSRLSAPRPRRGTTLQSTVESVIDSEDGDIFEEAMEDLEPANPSRKANLKRPTTQYTKTRIAERRFPASSMKSSSNRPVGSRRVRFDNDLLEDKRSPSAEDPPPSGLVRSEDTQGNGKPPSAGVKNSSKPPRPHLEIPNTSYSPEPDSPGTPTDSESESDGEVVVMSPPQSDDELSEQSEPELRQDSRPSRTFSRRDQKDYSSRIPSDEKIQKQKRPDYARGHRARSQLSDTWSTASTQGIDQPPTPPDSPVQHRRRKDLGRVKPRSKTREEIRREIQLLEAENDRNSPVPGFQNPNFEPDFRTRPRAQPIPPGCFEENPFTPLPPNMPCGSQSYQQASFMSPPYQSPPPQYAPYPSFPPLYDQDQQWYPQTPQPTVPLYTPNHFSYDLPEQWSPSPTPNVTFFPAVPPQAEPATAEQPPAGPTAAEAELAQPTPKKSNYQHRSSIGGYVVTPEGVVHLRERVLDLDPPALDHGKRSLNERDGVATTPQGADHSTMSSSEMVTSETVVTNNVNAGRPKIDYKDNSTQTEESSSPTVKEKQFNVEPLTPTTPLSLPSPIEKELPVTLEEFYYGTLKKITIRDETFDSITGKRDGREQCLQFKIERGMKAGAKFKFKNLEQASNGEAPRPTHFILTEEPHRKFKRNGNDLITTIDISVIESLCGWDRIIKTIDGSNVRVSPVVPTPPTWTDRFPSLGMPKRKSPNERGDLIIGVNIKWPQRALTSSQKAVLKQVFKLTD